MTSYLYSSLVLDYYLVNAVVIYFVTTIATATTIDWEYFEARGLEVSLVVSYQQVSILKVAMAITNFGSLNVREFLNFATMDESKVITTNEGMVRIY